LNYQNYRNSDRKQAEQRRKYAFLESVFEGEEEKGHFNPESGQAHHGARIQAHP
jgi:hypothetical protein